MPFYSAIRQEHWLRDKRDGGASVVLEDESLWEIDPSDRSKTARWLRISTVTKTGKEAIVVVLSQRLTGST